jgi:hypothetical protein
MGGAIASALAPRVTGQAIPIMFGTTAMGFAKCSTHPTSYNFVRIHKTLRTTPAMAANVTKRLWEIGDIVDVLEAWENTT